MFSHKKNSHKDNKFSLKINCECVRAPTHSHRDDVEDDFFLFSHFSPRSAKSETDKKENGCKNGKTLLTEFSSSFCSDSFDRSNAKVTRYVSLSRYYHPHPPSRFSRLATSFVYMTLDFFLIFAKCFQAMLEVSEAKWEDEGRKLKVIIII